MVRKEAAASRWFCRFRLEQVLGQTVVAGCRPCLKGVRYDCRGGGTARRRAAGLVWEFALNRQHAMDVLEPGMGSAPSFHPAELLVTPARLMALYENTSHPIRPLTVPASLLGHAHGCEVYLGSSSVARCHAMVISDCGRFIIRDLCTRETTVVNGQAVEESYIREGDRIEIGRFSFQLKTLETRAPAAAAAEARLVEQPGGRSYELSRVVSVIGRRGTCDISVDEDDIAKANTVLIRTSMGLFVRDLFSKMGTVVNNQSVRQARLRHGDVVRIGTVACQVEILRVGGNEALLSF